MRKEVVEESCKKKSSRVRGARARRQGKGARLEQHRTVQEEEAGERCKRQSATC